MTARSVIESWDDNNAKLFWLESDGTLHDTEYTQHGLYVSDHPQTFGVSQALVKKLFKGAATDENFDFDEAAALMCEEAFKRKWVRLLKVPWKKKILVEGQELTRSQRAVVEDMWFEDRSWEVIWYRWVSSKYGPSKDTVLFTAEDELTEAYAETDASDYSSAVTPWLKNLSPGLSDMIDMMEPMYDMIGDRKTIKSASGNFLAQYVEDNYDNLYLIGIASPSQKLRRGDVADFKDMVALLLSKLTSGKTRVTTPHENSMRMLDHVVREAKKQGIELDVEKGMKSAFGNKPELRYQQVEVRAR